MTRDGRTFAVICKTRDCDAKILLLAEARSIFPKRSPITSLLCPIGHRHNYTEADMIEIEETIQTSGSHVPC